MSITDAPDLSIATLTNWAKNAKYLSAPKPSAYWMFMSTPNHKAFFDGLVEKHARIIDVTTAVIGDKLYGVMMLEQYRYFTTVLDVIPKTELFFVPHHMAISEKRFISNQEFLADYVAKPHEDKALCEWAEGLVTAI